MIEECGAHGEAQFLNAGAGDAGYSEERRAMFTGLGAHRFDAAWVLARVDLTGQDNHRFREQLFAELAQLAEDNVEIVGWVAAAEIRDIDEMNEQPSTFDVAQELNAQAVSFVRAFDQAGNVGHDERMIARLDNAQIWFESGERVIGNFGLGGREP